MSCADDSQFRLPHYTSSIRRINLLGCMPCLRLTGNVTTLFDMLPSLQNVTWQHGEVRRSHPTARFPSHIEVVLDIVLDWNWVADDRDGRALRLVDDFKYTAGSKVQPLPATDDFAPVCVSYRLTLPGRFYLDWLNRLFEPATDYRPLFEDLAAVRSITIRDMQSDDLEDVAWLLAEALDDPLRPRLAPGTEVILHIDGADRIPDLLKVLEELRIMKCTARCSITDMYLDLCSNDCHGWNAEEEAGDVIAYKEDMISFLHADWLAVQDVLQEIRLEARLENFCGCHRPLATRPVPPLPDDDDDGPLVEQTLYAVVSLVASPLALSRRSAFLELCIRAPWADKDDRMLRLSTPMEYDTAADTRCWFDLLRTMDITKWPEVKVVARDWVRADRTSYLRGAVAHTFVDSVKSVIDEFLLTRDADPAGSGLRGLKPRQ